MPLVFFTKRIVFEDKSSFKINIPKEIAERFELEKKDELFWAVEECKNEKTGEKFERIVLIDKDNKEKMEEEE